MNENDVIIYLSNKYKGDIVKMIGALNNNLHVDESELRSYYEKINSPYVTIMDKIFPNSLRQGYCPAMLLYYHGNFSLASEFKRIYAYVGSREASEYGLEMARKIGHDCAKKGLILVSGMASGIDTAVMEGALNGGGKVIAVLGSPIDKPFPNINKDLYKRIKENGLILSEYPSGSDISKDNFPKRNRIIAGLAGVTIVGESSMRSGTMITVKYATELGRDIGAVPHPALSESGCNALIKDGAQLIESAEDIEQMLKDCIPPYGV